MFLDFHLFHDKTKRTQQGNLLGKNRIGDLGMGLPLENKSTNKKQLRTMSNCHWQWHTWMQNMHQEEKIIHGNFFDFRAQKCIYRIGFQEIKIRPWEDFELGPFFSPFLMRKRLSSGQKWFLRPYFPLIKRMFAFRSGLRFFPHSKEINISY